MSLIYSFNVIESGGMNINYGFPYPNELTVSAYGSGVYGGVGNKWGMCMTIKTPLAIFRNGEFVQNLPYGNYVILQNKSGDNITIDDKEHVAPIIPPVLPNPDPIQHATYAFDIGIISTSNVPPNVDFLLTGTKEFLEPIGYHVSRITTTPNNIHIEISALGTPALPLWAILAVITICLGAFVIISCNLTSAWVSGDELKKLQEKAGMLKTTENMLSGLQEEYNNGLIDLPTYNKLASQLLNIGQTVVTPGVPDTKSDIWGTLEKILPFIVIFGMMGMMKQK